MTALGGEAADTAESVHARRIRVAWIDDAPDTGVALGYEVARLASGHVLERLLSDDAVGIPTRRFAARAAGR